MSTGESKGECVTVKYIHEYVNKLADMMRKDGVIHCEHNSVNAAQLIVLCFRAHFIN